MIMSMVKVLDSGGGGGTKARGRMTLKLCPADGGFHPVTSNMWKLIGDINL
jgi:hypothetical protein